MPSRPRSPKPPAAPKPWRREGGRYHAADDRFTIEGGGAGRWFLTDEASLDELGLARTLGPYATLDDAKAAAAERREGGSEASPLAARIEAAKDRPKRTPTASASGPARASDAAQGDEPEPAPAPPPRTWLDELADEDAPAANRARRLMRWLDDLGIDDADGLVRRDVLGRQPAIASALLARSIAAAVHEAVGEDADRAAIDRAVAAVVETVCNREGAPDAGRELPGWRLVERPPGGDADAVPRRLIVSAADVSRA